ncbi:heat-shock protein Hsp20 [Massilia eurypsychrophila]|jgi:HSP20 family protein|uniref:Heat-shock protein Hsp20 n=1 Tax=Massilia eurypsychrophila TaxID=1485217 RepID=A0A2G8TI57_9BURK|nr:Hsp20/alpha crystallin family protein [Massilia eurypsychrophila]PIL45724.1 heat-shock protein Hsp20 [Massilia eurypsychrophila]
MNLTRRTGSPLARYRPSSIEDQLGRMVESMFEDFIAPVAQAAAAGRFPEQGQTSPRVNVAEDDNAFRVEAELPGVKKEDVKVSVDGPRVTIEAAAGQRGEQREGESVVHRERITRRFVRSFVLPTEVDDAGAEARLEDGLLRLTLPKKQASAARQLTIQ